MQSNLNELLVESIQTAEPKEEVISNCVNFNFDIKVLSVEGKFCMSGILDVEITIIGFKIKHLQIDLSDKQYCNTISVGVEEVQYSFYLKGSYLHTKRYGDGWFHKKQPWDAKIVCA